MVLQLLYQRDLNPHVPREEVEQFIHDRLSSKELEAFCLNLFDGVLNESGTIDGKIEASGPQLAAAAHGGH